VDQQGFVLSRQWRGTRDGVELEYWLATDAGAVQLILTRQQSIFFIPQQQCDQATSLLSRFSGWSCQVVSLQDFSMNPVMGFYFDQQRTLREARDVLFSHGLSPLESDINPYDRFLMERFVRGALRFRGSPQVVDGVQRFVNPQVTHCDYQPQLKVVSLDIETAMAELTLYSIAVYAVQEQEGGQGSEFRKVFLVSDHPVGDDIEVFANERLLLAAFFNWLALYDPDIIIGWNVINFDLWFLERLCQKHRIPSRFGRAGATAHWRTLGDDGDRRAVSTPGRVVLDGIELLKAATYQFESFALNTVAGKLLGDGKLIVGSDRGEKITELYRHDKLALAEYNVQDCKLVWDIFEKTDLLAFAIARSRLTGLPIERIGGSVAAFDFRYLPLLHREGFVAPNGHVGDEFEQSPGGFVMESQPGIYEHVLVLDFKSLYPSIIRTFKVDPLGMAIGLGQELDQSELVPGFKGAWFSKNRNLLPGIVSDLWRSRDEAKANSDSPLSQAIKIIMNSFYGVLGSGGCRFFNSRLASSITLRGHQIIQQTASFIEEQGWSVIYGDTDSVFVWLKNIDSDQMALSTGDKLAEQLNRWWTHRIKDQYGVDSFLELEFETHFTRFLMPTIRGSDQGSKKRYAGVVVKNNQPTLVFKGLESVRTDWTKLARDFQQELYRRIFFEEPFHDYIKTVVRQVREGECDSELVYRKRLRRKLEDYQKNIPPHVQAARKAAALDGVDIRRGDWVEYIITINGAEPVATRRSTIDYQHYIDRQLAPVADGILYFSGDSFEKIIDQQLGLF
jgi:DNA polymerase II